MSKPASLYCESCGSLVYVTKLSTRRRRAVCALLCCGRRWAWTLPTRFSRWLPEGLMKFHAPSVALAQRSFDNKLSQEPWPRVTLDVIPFFLQRKQES